MNSEETTGLKSEGEAFKASLVNMSPRAWMAKSEGAVDIRGVARREEVVCRRPVAGEQPQGRDEKEVKGR